MSQRLVVAAAQMGPVSIDESRQDVVRRLVALLHEAAARGARLVVFPEAALTPFFPHWYIADDNELDRYYETEIPANYLLPLFDAATEKGVAFYLGFAELTRNGRRFNTSILVSPHGGIIGKYRKIHIPGTQDPISGQPFQNLEKRYFEVGDLGFRVFHVMDTVVGMCICNDRRWCETYRALSVHGAEIVTLGYNTPHHAPDFPELDKFADEHNHLAMRAGAYQHAVWVIGTAKAGLEEGVSQIGGSAIISPAGEVIANASTLDDEIVAGLIDLDLVHRYRRARGSVKTSNKFCCNGHAAT